MLMLTWASVLGALAENVITATAAILRYSITFMGSSRIWTRLRFGASTVLTLWGRRCAGLSCSDHLRQLKIHFGASIA
jgi:hypothetical protein